MAEANINGARIFFQTHGSGFPVVFTHGLGGDHTMWMAQVPEFKQKYRLLLWDVRGHGRSETTEDGYSIPQFVDDLHALLGHLGIERAHIAGLSMGGWISWSFAIAYPGATASLVLSDSAGIQTGVSKEALKEKREMFEASAAIAEKHGRAKLADTTISLMFAKEFIENRPDTVELVKKRISQDPGIGYARTIRSIFTSAPQADHEEIKKRLAGIEAPCLVLAGELDQLTPMPTQEELARAIPGSRLEKIPGSGHVPPIEKPELWNRLVLDFLDGVSV